MTSVLVIEFDCYSCGSVSEKPRRMLGVALGSFSSICLGLTFYLLHFSEHPVTSVSVNHAGAPQISGVSRWLSSLSCPFTCFHLQSVFLCNLCFSYLFLCFEWLLEALAPYLAHLQFYSFYNSC